MSIRIDIFILHYLHIYLVTFTISTADLIFAVVEQAFKAHCTVSLLIISPDSVISKNLSTTLIEYYGLDDRALK